MMKRILLIIAALAAFASSAGAVEIRSIDIAVSLSPDGSAHFTEIWDITADRGTEWYLVKSNLRGMSVTDFSVSENGVMFTNEGDWDVQRSLSRKAGRCGIVRGKDGVELCWGLGSMGAHIFTVRYTITGAVQSLQDYDIFHFQLVSPGLTGRPEKVTAKISADGVPLSDSNTRLWGFGFVGESSLEDGRAVYRSTERFRDNSSVIVLLRLDKGIVASPNAREIHFNEVLSEALEGSSYDKSVALGEDEEDVDGWIILLGMLTSMLMSIGLIVAGVRFHYRSLLGVPSKKNIDWCRDVPYKGDVLQAEFVWRQLASGVSQDSPLAGAMILRMVERGHIIVGRDRDDKVEFRFNPDVSFDGLPSSYKALYDMMLEASGSDSVLQDKEFPRWSKSHTRRINKWYTTLRKEALESLSAGGYASASGKFNDTGREENRKLVGFNKFLKDFTLVGERTARDVGLWNDYLVFGLLFGLADKVAKELSSVDPQVFSETVFVDPGTARQIIWMTNRMGYAITNASASAQMKAASGGFGGGTSFGGGGGFSGGGFGGGAR